MEQVTSLKEKLIEAEKELPTEISLLKNIQNVKNFPGIFLLI